MNNFIGKKYTFVKNFQSNEINSFSGKNKPSLIQSPIQEEILIKKKNTTVIDQSQNQNHRLFFLNLLKKRNLIKKKFKERN